MIAEFAWPAKKSQFDAFVADNQPCHVWHDVDVMRVYTGDDMPQATVPESLTSRQFFFAMEQIGLLEQLLAAADQNRMLWIWVHKSDAFRIDHPMVETMTQQLGKTHADAVALWQLGATFEP